MNRQVVLALCASVIGTLGSRPVWAQDIASRDRVESTAHPVADELLSRPTTVNVTRVSLSQAIDAAATSAKVLVQYQTQVVDVYTAPITVHLSNVPLRIVLDRVLAGTALRVVADGPKRLAIISTGVSAERGEGAVTGIVTDASTRYAVAGATVTIDSGPTVKTRENGTYLITSVSAGVHRVTVRRIGYRALVTSVTVREGRTETLPIALLPSATVLNDVVTTATGDRRRFEVGHSVGTIQADSLVATTLIRNMSDLLQARVPGVIVSNTDGAVGAPSKIRLRGVNSLALNNDPIVIIDGVRMNAQTTVANLQTNVGSQKMLPQLSGPGGGTPTPPLAPSRLDDLDPNTIESIDVLRGPEASSLYGTDAANGVIVIKTKRGRPGAWRTTISGDNGTSYMVGSMPEPWVGWGHQNGQNYTVGCYLAAGSILTVSGGSCWQDSITHFNPQNYDPMKTLGNGSNRSLSANLSGGTESLQQFFSGRAASSVGMAKMSDVEQRVIARLWNVPAPSWMKRPNTEQDVDGSSRTTFNLSPAADISLTTTGMYRNVLNGGSGIQGFKFGSTSPADSLIYLPSESQRTKVTSLEKRGTLAVTGDYRPRTWLSFSGIGGGDYGQRTDQADLQAQYCTLALIIVTQNRTTCPSGHTVSRGETFVSTANGSANLSFTPFSWLNLRTALGEQYSHTNFYNLQVGNSNPLFCPLAFGTTLLTPNPVCNPTNAQQYAVSESRDEAATAGIYLEETVTLWGVYTTFGVRRDVASAFGGAVTKSPPNYPKFNFSYPLSDKSFFPKQPYVSSLRLRAAYGQSGNQASQTAVLNNYRLSNVTFGGTSTSTPAVSVTTLGAVHLRPEVSTSWEGGFDASFFESERIHLELNLYRKYTRDAIASSTLAPSLGNYSQYYNLGNVENRGLELGLTTKVLDTRLVNWDVVINGSKNTNKLVHKAPGLVAGGPLSTQFREGYPLYGYWGVPVESYADLNGNGYLDQSEIIFGQLRYLGAPYPKGEVTYGSTLSLWNGVLRFSTNIDHIIQQTTRLNYGLGGLQPRAAVDRTAPLPEQAAWIQAVVNRGYLGASSSVRVNELSATYTVPSRLLRTVHAQSLAITLAGRNVGMWSNYAGKDPNVDTSGLLGEATVDNGLGTPQPRSWTLRFTLGL